MNMVSHAHGQGYADLSFLIPETVREVEVRKGPYFAEYGNLSTAGTAQIRLRERFEDSYVKVQGGNHGTGRILGVLTTGPTPSAPGYVAVEAIRTDGPFASPQDFVRLNGTARLALPVGEKGRVALLTSGYRGRWDASGQIPLRAVERGRIDRFGAIDDSEGGESSRVNASATYGWQDDRTSLSAQMYASRYALDLWSNFTFVLNDAERGDGILQRDDRTVLGGHLQLHRQNPLGTASLGLDVRLDDARVGLFRQERREVFGTVVDSDLRERNVGLFLQQELEIGRRLRVVAGIRHDRFRYEVEDVVGSGVSGSESRSITQPKASLIFLPEGSEAFQLFVNYGRGFHGNDARSVIEDPTGRALAAADGYEVGALRRIGDGLEVSGALWRLDLEEELVWVGDEGVTEFSGATRRQGVELDARWKIGGVAWADAGLTYSAGTFRNSGADIPRAPRWSYRAGLSVPSVGPWSGDLRLRGIGDVPLNESGSATGEGYTVVDLALSRRLSDALGLSLSVENLLDTDFQEAQTWFVSRLPSEAEGVADNHFTPGNPLTFRLGLRASW